MGTNSTDKNDMVKITLIGAIYVAKGCHPDDVAEVTHYALKNQLNLADELYKAFYGE